MTKISWTWDRLFRIGNRIERRALRKARRSERVRAKLEREGLPPRRFRHLRARVRRISRRLERLEARRQEVLWGLKAKWLSEWDRLID
jgi:hypothetical protein